MKKLFNNLQFHSINIAFFILIKGNFTGIYKKFTSPNPTDIAAFLLKKDTGRPRDIKFLLLSYALLITVSLVIITKLNSININIYLNITLSTINNQLCWLGSGVEVKEAVTSTASFFTFFTKNKPEWLKSLFLIFLSFVLIALVINYTGTNPIGMLLANPFFYKLFKLYFIIGSILPLLAILYYSITIYFFIQFSKGKMSMPIYLPQFILNWLAEIKELSKISAKGIIIGYYFKLIIIYTLIFIYLVIFLLFFFN